MKYCLFSLLVFISTYSIAQEKDPAELYLVIDTEKGAMEFLLYKSVAPITVSSFVNLATRGYFDGLTFHRVVDDFMVQGGDPDGVGSGGPGYTFQDEIALRHNQAGILSMANSGPNTNGSQFFITHLPTPHLNGLHTVFGKIISGLDVLYTIRAGDVMTSVKIEGNARAFLEKRSDQVYQWNLILDENFDNLAAALVD